VSSQNTFLPAAEGGKRELVNRPVFCLPPAGGKQKRRISSSKGDLNMELNDTTDYQRCFVCGQRNPYGLHLVFRLENDTVVADFQPREEHQGFPGIIHGGIVAALLDETLGRTSMLINNPQWSMTGRLELRYRRSVPYGPLLRVHALLTKRRGRMIQATGALTLADDESVVFTEAQGSFMTLSPDVVDTILQDYPGLRQFLGEAQA